jgi:hypothetical protein
MAVEKKTPDGLAVNRPTRRTAAPDSATSRVIYTSGADLYNEPCSIWTMEVLSRTYLPSDTEMSKFQAAVLLEESGANRGEKIHVLECECWSPEVYVCMLVRT